MEKKNDFPFQRIVFGGGEGGGKSTALLEILELLIKIGYTPLLMPEIATQLFNMQIDFRSGSISLVEFQDSVVETTLALEKQLVKNAKRMYRNGKKPIVIYDRGLADSQIFISKDDYDQLLDKYNLTHDQVLTRYDAVFHMVTAADGAEEFYQSHGSRHQTPQQARDNDRALRKVWMGNQHFRLIPNPKTGWEGKLAHLKREILSFLGEPVPLERERKFLIPLSDLKKLKETESCHVLGIEQKYLLQDIAGEGFSKPRLRKLISLANDKETDLAYFLTKKRDTDNPEVRIEHSERLLKESYYAFEQLQVKDSKTIRKNRHFTLDHGKYFEIDHFLSLKLPEHENLPGIETALLEIELVDSETEEIRAPHWISRWVEVTDDPRYKNESLALSKNF